MNRLACLLLAMSSLIVGCAGPAAVTHGIPNLHTVAPGIYRGGQPDNDGWNWLRRQGVTNVVKLNEMDDVPGSTDDYAEIIGMQVHYLPISTRQQFLGWPDPDALDAAVTAMVPGTFIHCRHGWDRPGLAVGMYRLRHGWTKRAATDEMLRLGFHPQLLGLSRYWFERVPPTTSHPLAEYEQRAATPFHNP